MRIKDSKNKILFIIIILFILLFSRAYATIEKLSDSDRLSPLKTDNFTQKEWREIKQDGYMAYFYRRKYSKEEIMAVWKGVNELCPDYSREEKLLATRSILNYHWVVYRTTPFHNLAANVKVTRKYQHLIDKYSQLHQVPAKMVRGIITWENSGGTTKESWAACAGVGQLSRGAVKTAHEFYIPFVKRSRELADDYYQITRQTGFPLFNALARYHENDSEKFNVAEKHRQLRLKYKVEDERHIPECNLEDAVVYLKLLYNNYNQRMDLAISAYHNGGLNNNDIIRNYIKRNHGLLLDPSVEQTRIVEALDKHKIKFIDLWDDNISRDMLNGLRTVYGHQTNSYNRHLSLGDESDIYPWKIIAAYSILSAPGKTLKRLVKKYEGPWDVAELRGMKVYKTIPEVRQAIKEGR
ncbi:MAG: transglycosylase SLT domain-containing protein [Vulcanimicrobiota bacterium]